IIALMRLRCKDCEKARKIHVMRQGSVAPANTAPHTIFVVIWLLVLRHKRPNFDIRAIQIQLINGDFDEYIKRDAFSWRNHRG
ncbi:MAG: hypothetical protein ACK2U6_10820, partial [Candidatus Promineifilaceae bacterium]